MWQTDPSPTWRALHNSCIHRNHSWKSSSVLEQHCLDYVLLPWKTLTQTALVISFHKQWAKKPSRKHLPSLRVKAKICINNISHCSQHSPSLSPPPLFPCPPHPGNIQENAEALAGSTTSQQLNLYSTTTLQVSLPTPPQELHYFKILHRYMIFSSFRRPSDRHVNNLHWKQENKWTVNSRELPDVWLGLTEYEVKLRKKFTVLDHKIELHYSDIATDFFTFWSLHISHHYKTLKLHQQGNTLWKVIQSTGQSNWF